MASVYTCTIGRKVTQAKYFLNEMDNVVHLLESLNNSTLISQRNKSFADMRKMDPQNKSGMIFSGKKSNAQGSRIGGVLGSGISNANPGLMKRNVT